MRIGNSSAQVPEPLPDSRGDGGVSPNRKGLVRRTESELVSMLERLQEQALRARENRPASENLPAEKPKSSKKKKRSRWRRAWNRAKDTVSKGVEAVAEAGKSVVEAVADGGKAVVDAVAGGVSESAQRVGRSLSRWFSGARDGVHGLKAGQGSKPIGFKGVRGKRSSNVFRSFGRGLVQLGKQTVSAVDSLVQGAKHTVVGVARNVVEGGAQVLKGTWQTLTLRPKRGLKNLLKGAAKIVVQTPLDAVLVGAGKKLSAIQTLFGIEPVGRKLNDEEKALLKQYFGVSIDYDNIQIKVGKSGLFTLDKGTEAFVHGDTIYIPNSNWKGATDLYGNPAWEALLVHEAVHVWQHQNGGTDYISEALWAQASGSAYELTPERVQSTSWSDLNPEEQGELFEIAHREGWLESLKTGEPVFWNKNDPMGDDMHEVFETALLQLRTGGGAP